MARRPLTGQAGAWGVGRGAAAATAAEAAVCNFVRGGRDGALCAGALKGVINLLQGTTEGEWEAGHVWHAI